MSHKNSSIHINCVPCKHDQWCTNMVCSIKIPHRLQLITTTIKKMGVWDFKQSYKNAIPLNVFFLCWFMAVYGPTEVRPEGLGNIMHLIPMPAGYTSYSLREGRGGVFHVRASAIGPSARHNTRPPLFKVLIWRDCDQSELEALGTHGESNPGLTRSRLAS